MSGKNRTLYAYDCIEVLNDELAIPSNSTDLIYLDPPFNSKSTYNLPFKGKYKNLKPVMAFNDTWTWKTEQDEYLKDLEKGSSTRKIAEIINFTSKIKQSSGGGGGARK